MGVKLLALCQGLYHFPGHLFPSPCGVMGVKLLARLFATPITNVDLFPSPCGVMGVKHSDICNLRFSGIYVSVPLRGNGCETLRASLESNSEQNVRFRPLAG